jgi:hypothetical protein
MWAGPAAVRLGRNRTDRSELSDRSDHAAAGLNRFHLGARSRPDKLLKPDGYPEKLGKLAINALAVPPY